MTRDEFRREMMQAARDDRMSHATALDICAKVDALLATARAEALQEAAALVLGQALEWDAPDQDDPGCERTVLLGARNAIRALVSK